MRTKKHNILDILRNCNAVLTIMICSLLWYAVILHKNLLSLNYNTFRFELPPSCLCEASDVVFCFRMVITMSYYALLLNTTNLHGNPHLNYFLSAVVEVPAFIIAMLLLRYCSRRFCQSSTLLMGGATIFIIQLIPNSKTCTDHTSNSVEGTCNYKSLYIKSEQDVRFRSKRCCGVEAHSLSSGQ